MSPKVRHKRHSMRKSEKLFSADAFWNVNKCLAKKIGIVPAILLSELFWSRKRFKSEEFFITAKELEDTLGIGEEARRNALKKLSDLGLITVTAKGVPKRYFYQINDSRLDEIMEDTSDEETPTLETMEPSHSEQGNPDTIIKKDIKNNINKEKEREEIPPTQKSEDDPFYKTDLVYATIDKHLQAKWKTKIKEDKYNCKLIADSIIDGVDVVEYIEELLLKYDFSWWKDKMAPQPKQLFKAIDQLAAIELPDWHKKGFKSQVEYEDDARAKMSSSHSGMDDLKRQFFSGPMVSQERADQFMIELDELKEKINGKT